MKTPRTRFLSGAARLDRMFLFLSAAKSRGGLLVFALACLLPLEGATALAASEPEDKIMEDPSLLVDGGFERGHMGRFTSYGAFVTSDPREVSFGRFAVRLNPGTGLAYTVEVKPNTKYTFFAWGRVAREGEWFRIGVNGVNGRNDGHNEGVSSTKYELVRIDFTTGPDDRRIDVFAFKDQGSGPGLVDEFTLIEAR